MSKKRVDNRSYLPDDVIERIARCLWPDIQAYYESEEGQREFSEWKKNQQHDDNEMNNERIIENTDNFVS